MRYSTYMHFSAHVQHADLYNHFSCSDIIVGMGTVKPSQYVKQLLGSVKSMYEMRMPPEFVSMHEIWCRTGLIAGI